MFDASYTVLIVDDSNANRAYLAGILEEEGYRIVQAESGRRMPRLVAAKASGPSSSSSTWS